MMRWSHMIIFILDLYSICISFAMVSDLQNSQFKFSICSIIHTFIHTTHSLVHTRRYGLLSPLWSHWCGELVVSRIPSNHVTENRGLGLSHIGIYRTKISRGHCLFQDVKISTNTEKYLYIKPTTAYKIETINQAETPRR